MGEETTSLGGIHVSPNAIATIAYHATLQSYGVVGLAPRNIADGIVNAITRQLEQLPGVRAFVMQPNSLGIRGGGNGLPVTFIGGGGATEYTVRMQTANQLVKGNEVRVAGNWRDEYLLQFGQNQNNSLFGAEPTFVNSSLQIDLSTSYHFTEQLNVFFEALNVTDETMSTHGRFDNQLLDVFAYGRRFALGARYRM